MPRKLLLHIAILIFANLLIKPFWILGIDLKVQNVVGAASYGLYFAIFNFTFLFHILLDLGINQFNNREIAQNPTKLPEQFGQLLLLKGILSLLYFTVTFGVAYLIGFSQFHFKLLIWLAINQFLLTLILFARSNFTAMEWYPFDTFFSVFDRLLSIAFCLILLYVPFFANQFDVFWFVYAQTAALGISVVLALIAMLFKGGVVWPRFNLQQTLPYLKASFPFAMVVLLMTIYTRVDAVMIDRLLPQRGAYEAGIYAAGYRLLDAVNMVPYLFASILIPVFAKKLKQNETVTPMIDMAAKILLALAIGLTVVVIFYGEELVNALYIQATSDWVFPFVILLLSFNMICWSYLFGGYLTANNQLKVISQLALLAIVLNIVLNFLWIPKRGAAGAALATLITQGLMAVLQAWIVKRQLQLHVHFKTIVKFIIYSAFIVGVSYALQHYTSLLWLNLGVITLLGITLAFALRIIDWQQLLNLPQQNR